MQKNTLVSVNFKLLLACVMMVCASLPNAASAVSPVPLLVEQCLRYQLANLAVSSEESGKVNATKLERQLIGFLILTIVLAIIGSSLCHMRI